MNVLNNVLLYNKYINITINKYNNIINIVLNNN